MLAAIVTVILASTPLGAAPMDVDPVHVREIFAAKCAQCHGPQVSHPKGKFGFITDLKRLAGDPNYVVPGDLDGSYVWTQIDDGDMPPKKAKAGPLTDQEKTDIQEWIRAGAPAPAGEPETVTPTPPAPEPDEPRSVLDRAGALVGKLHILTIHFPIALLVAAALGESWSAL